MGRRRKPLFRRNEIVRIRATEEMVADGLAGLTGTVSTASHHWAGGWNYSVTLPRRRRTGYSLHEDDLESTGEMAPPEGDEVWATVSLRVDPETGSGTFVDEAGNDFEPDQPDEAAGLELFTRVLLDPPVPDDDDPEGVVVGKVQQPDGTWRYAVLLDDEREVRVFALHELYPRFWTEPEEFLDRARPTGLEEVERAEPLMDIAAWRAPAPTYGYDQEVRVAERPHTAPVVGRVGWVGREFLNDDLRWSYLVHFEDDPSAQYQSVTVAEVDLEPTGMYGEGYNPPPDWMG